MNLEDWEVGLIRAMLDRGDWTQQQIHAHFTRPDRDFHQGVIGEIKINRISPQVQPASAAALDDFLELLETSSKAGRTAVGAYGQAHHVEYRFLPVGQGLFSAGRLRRAGLAPFVWVYDCGTETQGIDIQRLIDGCPAFPVAGTDHKPWLDLVAISHFDVDHISGVVALLGRFDFGVLLLPYLAPWDRLVLLLDSGVAAVSPFARFLRDPVSFVREAGSVERIVLVRSGGEPFPPEGDVKALAPDGPKKWDIVAPTDTSAANQDGQVGIEVLCQGGALTVGGIWEFVPYCSQKFSNVFGAAFRSATQALADTFLAQGDQASLDALKAQYQNALLGHGYKGSPPRNHISLHLYAGPIGPIVAGPMRVRARVGMAPFLSELHLNGPDNSRIGQLMTGDADFRVRAFAEVRRFYTPTAG